VGVGGRGEVLLEGKLYGSKFPVSRLPEGEKGLVRHDVSKKREKGASGGKALDPVGFFL